MPYEIKVVRGKMQGALTYSNAGVSVNTTCWWDAAVKVDPGTYTGYATRMANKNDGMTGNKKREAIWFGKSVPINKNTRKSDQIFIHKGSGPSWSDGCIVIANTEVMKIWNQVTPKETANIKITIEDK